MEGRRVYESPYQKVSKKEEKDSIYLQGKKGKSGRLSRGPPKKKSKQHHGRKGKRRRRKVISYLARERRTPVRGLRESSIGKSDTDAGF